MHHASPETLKSQLNTLSSLDGHMTAINILNSCKASFPSTSAKLRRYTNRLINITHVLMSIILASEFHPHSDVRIYNSHSENLSLILFSSSSHSSSFPLFCLSSSYCSPFPPPRPRPRSRLPRHRYFDGTNALSSFARIVSIIALNRIKKAPVGSGGLWREGFLGTVSSDASSSSSSTGGCFG